MILYLHGFNSSAASQKAQDTLHATADAKVLCICPNLANRADQAAQQMQRIIQDKAEVIAIGSSLGGYYATWLVEQGYATFAVLINPAVNVAENLKGEIGKEQQNYSSDERYEFTQMHYDTLLTMKIDKIADPAKYLLLAQKGDELLDWQEAAEYYKGCEQIIEEAGNHSFEGYERHLPKIIEIAKSLTSN